MKIKLWHSILSPSYNSNIHPNTLSKMNKWFELNHEIEFERDIFNDRDCVDFLKIFDEKYGTNCMNFFISESDGRFKSDLWRLCILYEYGGLYVDIDQEPLCPLKEYIDFNKIDFCGGLNILDGNYFINGFLFSKNPKSQIIKLCLEEHLKRYELKHTVGVNGDMSAIHTMCKTIRNLLPDNHIPEGEVTINGENCLFLSEKPNPKLNLDVLYSYTFFYGDLEVMRSRYFPYYSDKNDSQNFVTFNKKEIFNKKP